MTSRSKKSRSKPCEVSQHSVSHPSNEAIMGLADQVNLSDPPTLIFPLPSNKDILCMMDVDVAACYGIQTRILNQAYSRNKTRFPRGFVYTISSQEVSAIPELSNYTRRNYNAFTEKGVLMLATVLNSPRAVERSIVLVETFALLQEARRRSDAVSPTIDPTKELSSDDSMARELKPDLAWLRVMQDQLGEGIENQIVKPITDHIVSSITDQNRHIWKEARRTYDLIRELANCLYRDYAIKDQAESSISRRLTKIEDFLRIWGSSSSDQETAQVPVPVAAVELLPPPTILKEMCGLVTSDVMPTTPKCVEDLIPVDYADAIKVWIGAYVSEYARVVKSDDRTLTDLTSLYKDAWHSVDSLFRSLYSIDIAKRKKNRERKGDHPSRLDLLRELGKLEEYYLSTINALPLDGMAPKWYKSLRCRS